MEGKELNLNEEIEGGGCSFGAGNSKGGDGFIDRSKVRILLCDNNSKSSGEASTLLLNCSYQVTSVRSARQVIDALNAEGPDIDIILAEVDLPMNKGMKMLKYIARDKELRRIPVIMMSAHDEVSIVVKCLRLGAADYLVKPLRTNELLNLWTHMWRRRRMLGLAEKGMLKYEIDLVVSDPSDANTNSTTMFSDDTDDMSRRCTNPEMGASIHLEDESVAVAAVTVTDEPSPNNPLEYQPGLPGISDRKTGQSLSSAPKKSQLKIGESSAFFTYVKSSSLKHNPQRVLIIKDNCTINPRVEDKHQASNMELVHDARVSCSQEAYHNTSRNPDSLSLERSCTPPTSSDNAQRNSNGENHNQMMFHPGTQIHHASGNAYPYYMPGVMNQVIMQSSAQVYQKNMHEIQNNIASAIVSQYNHLQQCSNVGGMRSFSYYPANFCLQPGQMPGTHSWGNSASNDTKANKMDRREAALMKFRQKRKERCFDKKIRYVNRKKLAERRPRVRGQFVRKMNGVDVDLNGQPANTDYDDDDEEEYDEQASRDSSPEDDAPGS